MTRRTLTRRDLFGAFGAAGAVALAARPAQAIRIEDANAQTQALYMAACEAQSAHEQLREEILAQIEDAEGRERALALIAAMSCPYCGCKLGQIQPYDAKF